MKKCSNCKVLKLKEEFNKKNSSNDGLSYYCKECNKKKLKQHYKENKEYYYNKSRKYILEIKKWFSNYKKTLKCIKCGETRYWVLDFHHRDKSLKEGNISSLLKIKSKEFIMKEVSKCDVLCSNCHRDLHHKLNIAK